MDEKFLKTYRDIGVTLRKIRKEKELSQEQLGQKAGNVDRSKISDIENGKEDFVFSTLLKLCFALEVDVKQIFSNSTSIKRQEDTR
ncbi:helix-turn-helix transcriptional regulator [Chryseobacterium caseinilyticum]|uniref:Helix-turn-helix transcriptional regulator n=1 Tax=Chryseobacterium caseinilyticum TaxID=2771428 RepID=A0ABR8ZF11_9FLAO|nr:helix-turn-helix transcriptional regulator [Chryseobacterium caseinilyticum]MBD8083868.1 helix-turn-helix transcriptional regulator [Chryseobacterium caseinilyticum]